MVFREVLLNSCEVLHRVEPCEQRVHPPPAFVRDFLEGVADVLHMGVLVADEEVPLLLNELLRTVHGAGGEEQGEQQSVFFEQLA